MSPPTLISGGTSSSVVSDEHDGLIGKTLDNRHATVSTVQTTDANVQQHVVVRCSVVFRALDSLDTVLVERNDFLVGKEFLLWWVRMHVEHVHEHADLQRLAVRVRVHGLADDHDATVRRRQDRLRARGHGPGRIADTARLFRQLRHLFSPYGCIQFMHCSTGRGPQGSAVLKAVADATGVPATAVIGATAARVGQSLTGRTVMVNVAVPAPPVCVKLRVSAVPRFL